ncbi:C40 family peptidase [Pseudomonas citronellolis]|uniref:C40 family peptidase n=1 Tax=Pseudomonas citronellolis TaxID=53408 RepID=UPI0023E407CA|nr:C40 family peptidase [Pseudomonas citronellolis]MDF3931723.1 C40 family peptidase [Pseudomonas citronellolis]
MHTSLRVLALALISLLAACASHPPPAPPPVVYAPSTSMESDSAAANDVLIRAIGLVGTPYRWGGNTPDGGFDCSGLIGFVYRDTTGMQLPRSTREMIGMRAPNVGRESLQSGDLVFFATNGGRNVSHAGIYVGEGRFVHAPRTGGTVRLDSLDSPYWQKAFLEAKRVLAVQSLALHP